MAKLDWYIRANLKIRHFQWVIALDDFRSISRAALFLDMGESQLHKGLTALEQSLDAVLFEHSARGLQPTEFGSCVIRHGRQVLNRLLSAQEELRDMDEGRVARVKLGVLPAATASLVPSFIAKLENESVPVAVSVREGSWESLSQWLAAGSIDLAVSILPPRLPLDHLNQELLYEDQIMLAVRKGHPLLQSEQPTAQMLAQYPVVMPPPGSWFRQGIDQFLLDNGLHIHRMHVYSTSTLTNVGVLQFTDSVGFMAQDVAQYFADLGVLSVLPLKLPETSVRVGMIWMRDRHMAMELKLVHMILRETVQAMGVLAKPQPMAHVQAPYKPVPLTSRRFW
jgi:DNA-binding transcriptional LysR family regulator